MIAEKLQEGRYEVVKGGLIELSLMGGLNSFVVVRITTRLSLILEKKVEVFINSGELLEGL